MIVDDSIFVDKNSYDKIWEIVINPTIKEYQSTFSEVTLANNAKEVIWEEYVRLNKYCKNHYMQDNGGKLDRHKVCACYMYAIMQANVLDCKLAGSDTERSYLALNENLAITVGMSVLTAFITLFLLETHTLQTEAIYKQTKSQ